MGGSVCVRMQRQEYLSRSWDLRTSGISESRKLQCRKRYGKVFWAAGKLYSLKKMQMPAVMVDLDLIIWKDIRNIIKDTDICAIHREGIFPDVYPGKEFFHMKPEYRFDPDWSFEVLPVNTCMLYIADEAFKNYYVDSSITFMENCLETEENLCHMVLRNSGFLRCAQRSRESRYHLFSRFGTDREPGYLHTFMGLLRTF